MTDELQKWVAAVLNVLVEDYSKRIETLQKMCVRRAHERVCALEAGEKDVSRHDDALIEMHHAIDVYKAKVKEIRDLPCDASAVRWLELQRNKI